VGGKSGCVGVRAGKFVLVGVRLGLVGVVGESGLASGPRLGMWCGEEGVLNARYWSLESRVAAADMEVRWVEGIVMVRVGLFSDE
jgi:hypothetical protein